MRCEKNKNGKSLNKPSVSFSNNLKNNVYSIYLSSLMPTGLIGDDLSDDHNI